MKIIVELPNSFDINKAEKTFVKFKNGNIVRLMSWMQCDKNGEILFSWCLFLNTLQAVKPI